MLFLLLSEAYPEKIYEYRKLIKNRVQIYLISTSSSFSSIIRNTPFSKYYHSMPELMPDMLQIHVKGAQQEIAFNPKDYKEIFYKFQLLKL
ncbi:hypothetical protein CR203_23805 [Salipaludibacillus neizhouensis]|uniref:Uncharacterized protein n=1 Tax=Salipaludibacillus neizhouensis TaxID=885475 RepID=A0A3A9KJ23_9BACI|nr:hypothetical protein [Salipaludibacillus neizhouensis]RKL64886.1 hypothetical protein CR203_23805 [Salipaludibacillus neizhouensis]